MWVGAPIPSLGYCTAFILASAIFYYASSYIIDWYAEWLRGDSDQDEDEENGELQQPLGFNSLVEKQ